MVCQHKLQVKLDFSQHEAVTHPNTSLRAKHALWSSCHHILLFVLLLHTLHRCIGNGSLLQSQLERLRDSLTAHIEVITALDIAIRRKKYFRHCRVVQVICIKGCVLPFAAIAAAYTQSQGVHRAVRCREHCSTRSSLTGQ